MPCGKIHLNERDLEMSLQASIKSQIRLILETETKHKKEDLIDGIDKEIQYCQMTLSRCKAKQVAAFEDYAENRITRQEYLSCKKETASQQEELTARYMQLSARRAEIQQASGPLEKSDLGRYACVGELTRELLVELVKEIRVSGEDTLEIVWNFKELTAI